MRRLELWVLCAFLLVTFVAAQTGKPKKQAEPAKKTTPAAAETMPKPSPELERLGYLVGDWTSQGTIQPSPSGPGGKFSGSVHNEWYPGGFFLMTKGEMTMSGMGAVKELAIFGYDPEKKVYTYHGINSVGEALTSTGTVSGADWTWTNETTVKGKTYKNKFTVHEESPTSYTMKLDISEDGGKTWKTVMDGKATKKKKGASATK